MMSSNDMRRFKTRMQNFDTCSFFTKLSLDDAEWPLINGSWKGKVTARNAFDDLDYYKNSIFDPRSFYDFTVMQLVTCGGGPRAFVEEIGAMKIVLPRVMKTLQNYLNFMYRLARFRKKKIITCNEVNSLMEINEFRYYLYMKQFYPEVRPDTFGVANGAMEVDGALPPIRLKTPLFLNTFTDLIHYNYHNLPECQNIYNSEEHLEAKNSRSAPSFPNRTMFEEETKRVYSETAPFHTFISPNGYYSRYHAFRFHEALGLPPMETEIIMVIDWLAKLCIVEIVIKAILCSKHRQGKGPLDVCCPELIDYFNAFQIIDVFHKGDPLEMIPMNFRPPACEIRPLAPPKDRPNVGMYYRQRRIAAEKRYAHRQRLLQYYADNYMRHFPTRLRTLPLSSYRRERAR